jgi:hypothetical protein
MERKMKEKKPRKSIPINQMLMDKFKKKEIQLENDKKKQ